MKYEMRNIGVHLAVLVVMTAGVCRSQNLHLAEYLFPESNWAHAMSVDSAASGGYIAGGYAFERIITDKSKSLPEMDLCVVRLGSDLDTSWTRSYPDLGHGAVNWISNMSGGGFICAGYLEQGNHSYGVAIGLDSLGRRVWHRSFASLGCTEFNTGKVLDDGSILIVGHGFSRSPKRGVIVLVCLDSRGSTLWKNWIDLGHEKGLEPRAIKELNDNRIGILVHSDFLADQDIPNSKQQPLLAVIDKKGTLIWKNAISSGWSATDFCALPDGGFLFVGSKEQEHAQELYFYQNHVVRTNARGDVLWTAMDDSDDASYCSAIIPEGSGNALVLGYSQSEILAWRLSEDSTLIRTASVRTGAGRLSISSSLMTRRGSAIFAGQCTSDSRSTAIYRFYVARLEAPSILTKW